MPDNSDRVPVENSAVRTEASDASFRWILSILIGGAITLGIVLIGVGLFFRGWRAHEEKVDRSPFPLAPIPSTALPPEPRVEQLDRLAGVQTPNVAIRQRASEAVLNRYGATDEKGYVHIPIDQAITLLVDQHLPIRPAPTADDERRAGGLLEGGMSNSGRTFRRSQP